MSTEQLWFTRRAGQVRGPYPADRIGRYLLLGRLCDEDEVSPDRQRWRSIAACPELIPEELRQVETAEDRHRLAVARRAADERRGGDRRARRMAPPRIERRHGDRRGRGRRHEDHARQAGGLHLARVAVMAGLALLLVVLFGLS